MLTLDTSALFALINRRDESHSRAVEALRSDIGPYIVPAAIFAENAYLLEQRMPHAVDAFLADLESGAYELDCGDRDLPRIRQLVDRYQDMYLGAADSAVIACAERNGGRVLTFDERHFSVVAREGQIVVVPGAD